MKRFFLILCADIVAGVAITYIIGVKVREGAVHNRSLHERLKAVNSRCCGPVLIRMSLTGYA